MKKNAFVGKSAPRKEGSRKVTGQAKYIDDLTFPDMLHGATIRSPLARGKIKAIHFAKEIPWGEFTIVTAKDIAGKKNVTQIYDDQPFLADNIVNHPEEPVVLIAHPDKLLVEKARHAITIEMDPLPAVLTLDESLAKKEIIWGKDNCFKEYHVQKGNVDEVWKRKGVTVVEGEYETGAQEQLYIEPNGMIGVYDANGVTVWGSMQCPYYVHKALVPLFDLSNEKVRVIQTETGGGFGGKEEYPSIIAGHAALLAMKAKKPVKLIYDRAEDMVATTKRHPSRTRVKTAFDTDGKLLALDIEFIIDGGAYATLSSVVLSRGTIHAAGPYFCPNVRIHSRAMATNTPPQGAFRGFGAPQSIFALERHLDKSAKLLGKTPEALRKINFLRHGETTATGQIVHEKIDMRKLLDKTLAKSGYAAKKKAFAKANAKSSIKKGIGFASFFHGSGFTGSGEKTLGSIVGMEVTKDGRPRVLAASTEIGQGTNTIFSQITAEALGIDYEFVDVLPPDTKFVPNSGPTVASRTVMIVGKLVESAAIGLKETLTRTGFLGKKYSTKEFQKACLAYMKKHGELKCFSEYKQPPHVNWDDSTYQGDAYGAYAWAVYVAEVSVDMTTYSTQVDDFWAAQEVGRVIHPIFAEGQIEGGVAQGIGYTLYEKVIWDKGKMANPRMTNYIVPTAADVPNIHVFFDELPYEHGPSGAKGIGELPMDGPAPAILSAIENATGLAMRFIPLMPEDLMIAFEKDNA